MTDRIDPTAEDLAIVARNVRRMLRWDAALRRDARSARDTLEAGKRFVGALRRMTADYLEFAPYGVERKSNVDQYAHTNEINEEKRT